jgi:hypothetical protein
MIKGKRVQQKQRRALQTGQSLFDPRMTAAAVALADTAITCEREAAELFAHAAVGRHVLAAHESPSLEGDRLEFSTYDWEHGQTLMRKWLPRISRLDTMAASATSALLGELRSALTFMGTVEIDVRARDLHLLVRQDSIGFCAVRGVLPFFLEFGWPPSRIFQCQLATCGKWFLRKVKAGPQEMYCCSQHQNLAKQRRFRGQES